MLAKKDICESEYLRHRTDPQPGDPAYLHLSDLLLGLRPTCPATPARLLDFGCGGSPYRTLFPQAAPYHRADFTGFPDVDFSFDEDSRLPLPDAGYDIVLSTQVLEHVRNPEIYLRECYRLLVPGGRLLLSTHGTYLDHGCPYDFQRWTADGLRLALVNAGFAPQRILKLTSGARALIFLARTLEGNLVTADRSPLGWGLRLFQRILRRYPAAMDAFCDRAFPADTRVHEVTPANRGPGLYIALFAVGMKPARA